MQPCHPASRFRRLIWVAIAIGSAASLPSIVRAERYYVGPNTGSWNNPAHWSATIDGPGGAGVPTAGEFVYLRTNEPILNRNITLDVTTPEFARVRLGSPSGQTTLTQTSNVTLTSVGEFLGSSTAGFNTTGIHTQTAGLNHSTWLLVLGEDMGTGGGTYNLSGTGSVFLSGTSPLADFPGLYVGRNSRGLFNHNGGTVTVGTVAVPASMSVGHNSTGTGTYNLSSGALNTVGGAVVGFDGVGTFIQSGGTHVSSDGVYLGFSSGWGSYIQSGGVTTIGFSIVANQGRGTLNVSGGIHHIESDLVVGRLGGAGTVILGGTGILTVGDSEFVGLEALGFASESRVSQSGGTHTIGTDLFLGQVPDTYGIFDLSGGVVNVGGNVHVGANPIHPFGGDGTLSISGGSMNVSGILAVGTEFVGMATLSGGTLRVGGLTSSPGQFKWTGGTLKVTNSNIDISAIGPLGNSVVLTSAREFIPEGGLNIGTGAALSVSGGTLSIPSTMTNFGNFNQTSGTTTVNGTIVNRGTANFGGSQSWGPASVFVNSAGVATFNSPLGISGYGPVVVVTGGSVHFNASPGPLSGLAITSALVTLSAGADKTLVTTSLSIDSAPGSKLDLADNDAIVNYTTPSPSPIQSIRQHIAHAYTGGAWTGDGITTSMGTTTRGLGYGDNSLLGYTSFGGYAVDSDSVLIKFTFYGDANLDGVVNLRDLVMFANGWQTGSLWTEGDFNYDGLVDALDLGLLARNWQSGDNAPLGVALDQVEISAVVPEPMGSMSLALAGMLLLRRRRIMGGSRAE